MRNENRFERGMKKRDVLLNRGLKINAVNRKKQKPIKSKFREAQEENKWLCQQVVRPMLRGGYYWFTGKTKYKRVGKKGFTLARHEGE